MPLDKYNSQLERAAIAIFNNKRQQALGNIIALLWMGCKVYLNPSNPIYLFLKRKGFHVFEFTNELTNDSFLKGISYEDRKTNQKLLSDLLREDVLLDSLKQQLVSIE